MISPFLSRLAVGLVFISAAGAASSSTDPRDFQSGNPFPKEGYCDQPYIVKNTDGSWLLLVTTGPGKEGGAGQHIIATVSRDEGKTWSKPVDVEPGSGPHASWAVPLITPSGRVYAFYTYNGDKVDSINGNKEPKGKGKPFNPGLVGWYCFKYSDDGGLTWSERKRLPLPVADVDLHNDWKGAHQMFWGIDKPSVTGGDVVFAFTRIGKYLGGKCEGWLFRSDNLLTEKDPDRIHWQLLPEGGKPIKSAKLGDVQQEFNIVPLDNGDLYVMLRTNAGFAANAYSRDGGKTWTEPVAATYADGTRVIKTPTACPQLWKTSSGRYLFWFHNNSFLHSYPGMDERLAGVGNRNIAWLAAGEEKAGKIKWSEPEIVSWHSLPDHKLGPSYPDLIEDHGNYFISSTVKEDGRMQAVDHSLIDDLFRQRDIKEIARRGLVLEADAKTLSSGSIPMPHLPDLATGGGFTIDLWLDLPSLEPGQVLLDSRDAGGKGIAVTMADNGALRFDMSDGTTAETWTTDAGAVKAGRMSNVVFIADGGPKVLSVVVDGKLNDGGKDRPYGYARFLRRQDKDLKDTGPDIGDVSGSGEMKVSPFVKGLRIYDRYLRTTEAVGNYRMGPSAPL